MKRGGEGRRDGRGDIADQRRRHPKEKLKEPRKYEKGVKMREAPAEQYLLQHD